MRLSIIILFFIGIIISILGYYKNIQDKPPKVEYRHISKSIEELYSTQKGAYDTYFRMFNDIPILA